MNFRKITSAIILALIMITCSCFIALAESGVYATVDTEGEVCCGEEIEICVNISGGRGIRGIAVVPVFVNDAFSLVSGKWMVSGAVSDFSIEEGNGVIAFDSPVDLDGTILTFVISALDSAELGNQVVSAEVIIVGESGRYEISTEGVTIEIKCDHSDLSGWKSDADSHWSECACGHKADAEAHAWNEGTVTKEPTETEAGERTYTCSICGRDRIESIDKLEENPQNSIGFVILAVAIVVLVTIVFLMKYKGITSKSPGIKNEEMNENLTKSVSENDEKSEDSDEDIINTEDKKEEVYVDEPISDEGEKTEYINEVQIEREAEKTEHYVEDAVTKEIETTEPSSDKDITKEETFEYVSGESSEPGREETETEAETIENAHLDNLNQKREDAVKDISEGLELDVEECVTEGKKLLDSKASSKEEPTSAVSTDGE